MKTSAYHRSVWILALATSLLGAACMDDVCRPGTICTVVGTGVGGFSRVDGLAGVATELDLPIDVTVGPDGQLYIMDWHNHRIRVLTHQGTVRTVAGTGELGDGPEGPALESAFNHPTQVIFDPQGRMIIAAWLNSRVKRLDPTTGIIEDIGGTGARAYEGDGGPARDAALDLPVSVVFDVADNLLVMDQANQVIRRIDAAGTIDTFAGQCITGMCAPGEEPVKCPGASNKRACGIEEDPYACSGGCSPGFAGDGDPATELRMAQPFGGQIFPAGRMAVDADGTIYFADTRNHRVRRIDRSGVVSTVAGNGVNGYAGDGGPAVAAQLDNPTDVDIGQDGTLYIADTLSSCVRAVWPDGVITTVAGICGQRGFDGDGRVATEALLDRPYGIELDGADNLYVVDTHNHRVRLVLR